MCTKFSWLIVIAGSLFAAGCTLVEFDQLVPSAVSNIDTTGIIQICKSTSTTNPTAIAIKQGKQLATIQSNTQRVRSAFPQIGAHPVVNAVLQHVEYISTNSIVQARSFLTNGQTAQADQDAMATVSKPVASEAVKRLTVAIAAPILEAIEVVQPLQIAQGGRMLTAASVATSQARKIQLYSSPFTSATRSAL